MVIMYEICYRYKHIQRDFYLNLHEAVLSGRFLEFCFNRSPKRLEKGMVRWSCYGGRRRFESRILLAHAACGLEH